MGDASTPDDDHGIEPGHGRLTTASQARLRRATWATIIDPLLTRL